LLKEGIGYSRDFKFDAPSVRVADDLLVSRLFGSITLTRTPQGLYANGRLRATTQCECARCLTEFEQPVSSRLAELFIYPPENAPEGALTVGDDVHLDLAPLVREDMLLAVPMHALCRPNCNGLCPQCGQNWNDGPCTCTEVKQDPRWNALANLLKESSETPS
jgi:uncharacterized protein